MAGYTSPTASQIQDWTGINTYILDLTSQELSDRLTALVALAEAEAAIEVGESVFDGTGFTARQVTLLQMLVAYRTAVKFLLLPELQVATGSHEPLLMDQAQIDDTIERFQGEAARLVQLLANGADATQEVHGSFSEATTGALRVFTREMEW